MLSVFGDESTDETQSRVFAVGGVVGRETDWQATEAKWLGRTEGKLFHATDCEHDGEKDLHKDLTAIIAESKLGAIGFALDLTAFREFFPPLSAEVGYYKCFTLVVSWHVENAKRLGERIEFTFDHRRSEYNAGKLYDTLANKPDWGARLFMDSKVHFDSPKQNPRLQIADLFARETMKCLDNQIRGIEPRTSLQTLIESRRVAIKLIDREYCSQWRAAIDDAEEKGDEASGTAYASWLKKNKRIDNMSNRIAYINWLQSRKS